MRASPTIITEANGFTLPPETDLQRDFTRSGDGLTPHYLAHYDRDTLFYDHVFRAEKNLHVFTAPAFLNLWGVFRRGLRRNGRSVRWLVRRNFVKSEQVIVRASEDALSLEVGGVSHPLRPRPSLAPHFAGLNCVIVLSKNNQLDWIRDWAGYYAKIHRLQAVMLFDNASTAYSPEDIAEVLSTVPGISRVAVMRTPFSYGPVDGGKGLQRPVFLQPAVLNLARVDACADARAVLNVDIDEIIRPLDGISVFDAARERRHSMVKVHGSWVYPAPETPLPAPQRAHHMRAVPNKRCNQKWCAVPQGVLSRFGWSPHHVGGELVRLAQKDVRFELLHCRGASTGWKSKRFDFPTLAEDPDLAAFMSEAFPAAANP